MLMTIVGLALVFIVGLFNVFFFFSPKKFHGWILFLLPKISSVGYTTTAIAPNKEKISVHYNKAELEQVFATFDKNGDGFITKQELRQSLKNIGISFTDKEVCSMVEKLDSNGDGVIDSDEFFELYESMGRPEGGSKDGENSIEEEMDLKEAFDVFDMDGDDLITVEELGSVLSSLGLKQGMRVDDCKEMIRKVDKDGDGMVSFVEFKQMMKSGTRLIEVS